MSTVHVPILVGPIRDALMAPFQALPPEAEPHWLVDCTLGGGGHCHSFLEFFQPLRCKSHNILISNKR